LSEIGQRNWGQKKRSQGFGGVVCHLFFVLNFFHIKEPENPYQGSPVDGHNALLQRSINVLEFGLSKPKKL
jgi:hypothetical protein